MRNTTLLSLALAACAPLGLVATSAHATTINVNLKPPGCTTDKCTVGPSFTNSNVTFEGWQYNSSSTGWNAQDLTYKDDADNETGLGVSCGSASGTKCGQDEINATPPQLISVGIGGITFTSLNLDFGSVDSAGNGSSSVPESVFVYGATCDDVTCGNTQLYTYAGSNYPGNAANVTFTAADLSTYSFLYVTPICPTDGENGDIINCGAPDSNILLASMSYDEPTSVPEPGDLGMMGFGLAVLGFAGYALRRRHAAER